VPVLTEVVVLPKAGPPPAGEVDEFPPVSPAPAFAATAPAPLAARETARPAPVAPALAEAATSIDEARVAQRVLADIDRQLDLMFEHRLREVLTPVLARMTDSLVREMRNQLAANMREMVARAVSIELDRLQKR
jgi:hypothetical protein